MHDQARVDLHLDLALIDEERESTVQGCFLQPVDQHRAGVRPQPALFLLGFLLHGSRCGFLLFGTNRVIETGLKHAEVSGRLMAIFGEW